MDVVQVSNKSIKLFISMCPNHKYVVNVAKSKQRFVLKPPSAFPSKFPMKRLAKAGAILVPIAVPCCWKKCSPLKTKLFMVKIIRIRSQIDSVGRDLICQFVDPGIFYMHQCPRWWGFWCRYKDDTSRVTRIASAGRTSRSLSLLRRWVVSLCKKVESVLEG